MCFSKRFSPSFSRFYQRTVRHTKILGIVENNTQEHKLASERRIFFTKLANRQGFSAIAVFET